MGEVVNRIKNGIVADNPVFVQVLGMCPTLAVTTSAVNGLGMGLATAIVLICANLVISLLRNIIPSKVRIPAFIVVIATFVTIVDLVLAGYVPDLHSQLGLFIPLIVVNCVVLGRAEAYASKNNPINSIADGVGIGLGFSLALTIIGATREILGAGEFFGMTVIPGDFKIGIFGQAPGAFIALGLLFAGFNYINNKSKDKKA